MKFKNKIKKLLRRTFIHIFCLRTIKKDIVLPLYLYNDGTSTSPPNIKTLRIIDAKVSRHDPTLVFLSKKTKFMIVRSVENYLEREGDR